MTKTELTKEERITREQRRLRAVFKTLEPGKLRVAENLIRDAAWMAVTLEDLQRTIDEEGIEVEYQNGANQHGTKQSEAVKTHIAMMKNYASAIKLLTDIVPEQRKKESRLEAFRNL